MEMTEGHKGTLLMLACAVLWSIGGVFIKLIDWNPLAIAGVRSLIAAGVIALYMVFSRCGCVLTRRTVRIAFSLSGTALLFVAATKLTTAANAVVIQYTAPVFLLLYYVVFRKQRFLLSDYAVVFFTVAGIAVFFFDRLGGGTTLGNLVALGSGLFMTSMLVTTGDAPYQERISGILQGQLLTALIGTPFLFLDPRPVTAQALLCILVLGVFQLGISYAMYASAMKTCSSLVCIVLASLEPLLNPVWVYLFYGERPGPLSLFGGAVVIVAITLWCVGNERRAARTAAGNP